MQSITMTAKQLVTLLTAIVILSVGISFSAISLSQPQDATASGATLNSVVQGLNGVKSEIHSLRTDLGYSNTILGSRTLKGDLSKLCDVMTKGDNYGSMDHIYCP